MSGAFFAELGIPDPDVNLGAGGGTQAEQTSAIMVGYEKLLSEQTADLCLVVGDVTSTMACAIVAKKALMTVVHVEGGIRSRDLSMPEEINRIMCDQASTLLFSPTATGLNNLINEGFNKNTKTPYNSDNPGIFHCGDIMYDNSLYFKTISQQNSTIISKYNLEKDNYVLCTIHRNNNTDDPERLNAIFSSINKISNENNIVVIIPLHPRTNKLLNNNLNSELLTSINLNKHIKIIEPVSFLDMIALESNCKLIMPDSGGVQKEAYYFNKPSIILRSETEWVEIVEHGAAIITDANEDKIDDSYNILISKKNQTFPLLFGDGKAAEFICETMLSNPL
jgi:UDP-GlcNAc3NAcA epimerase